MARGLKFRIQEVQGLCYQCSENKGADQLRGHREADLHLCFHICKKPVFSPRGSNKINQKNSHSILLPVTKDMRKAYLSIVLKKPVFGLFDQVGLKTSLLGYRYRSLVIRKPDFCICENKDADQPRGNREADQRLFFRYIDSTIPLISTPEISRL